MKENNNPRNGGIGILGLLGVVFVTLKLTGYISWAWWVVLWPFWIGFVVLLGVMLVLSIPLVLGHAILKIMERNEA